MNNGIEKATGEATPVAHLCANTKSIHFVTVAISYATLIPREDIFMHSINNTRIKKLFDNVISDKERRNVPICVKSLSIALEHIDKANSLSDLENTIKLLNKLSAGAATYVTAVYRAVVSMHQHRYNGIS